MPEIKKLSIAEGTAVTSPTNLDLSLSAGVYAEQSVTPSTPPTDTQKIYCKTDGLWYTLNDLGVETLVGSGSGQGEVNININPNADGGVSKGSANGIGDWIVSGTGLTVSKTTTASEIPMNPLKLNAIKLTNGGSGNGYVRIRMQNADALLGYSLKTQFRFETGGGFVSNDIFFRVFCYTDSAFSSGQTRLPTTIDSALGATIDGDTTGARISGGTFLAPKVDTLVTHPYIEIRFYRQAGSASSWLSLNDVIIGPGIQPQGPVVGEWTSYTPTFNSGFTIGSGGTATQIFKYKREGSDCIITGRIELGTSGASMGSGLFKFSLPSGITPNQSLLGSGYDRVGIAYTFDAGGGGNRELLHVAQDAATSSFFIGGMTNAGVSFNMDATNPFTFAAGDQIFVNLRVPIAEWAGSGTVNLAQNDVEYASTFSNNLATWDADSSTTVYGPQGQLMYGALTAARTKTVTFISPIQATDSIVLESSIDGIVWLPLVGGTAGGSGGSPVITSRDNANTLISGVTWRKASSNSVHIDFARYASIANDDSPVNDWGAHYWRVKKTAAGVATGWGKATETASGLAPQGVFKAGLSNTIALQPLTVTPQNPNTSSDGHIYIKGSKLIIQFNDAGTIRYKYLDLTSTGVTWVHTLTPP